MFTYYVYAGPALIPLRPGDLWRAIIAFIGPRPRNGCILSAVSGLGYVVRVDGEPLPVDASGWFRAPCLSFLKVAP